MTEPNTDHSLSSTLRLTIQVALLSGVAGFMMLLQEIVIASYFATNQFADAYQLAISFPLLAINVFAGGTLLAVLVPLLTQLAIAARHSEAVYLISRARFLLGWSLLAIGAVWALLFPHVATLVARGFSAETLTLSVRLLWLILPVLYFAGMAGIDIAVLNSRRQFLFIATVPMFMPAGVMIFLIALESQLGIYAAALGLLCGSILQWITSRRLTTPLLCNVATKNPRTSGTANLVSSYGKVAASAAMLSGILLTDTLVASTLATGSTATYGYAVRPVILTIAFVTAVVGNVTLPLFSRLVVTENWRDLKKHMLFWYFSLTAIALLFVAVWYCYATEVVTLLYQRGAFVASDTARVAAVQQIYMLHIPLFLIALVGWRVMNSMNKHMIMLAITTVCFIINWIADTLLAPRLGIQGIAWGTNLAFCVWAILITLYLLAIHRKTVHKSNTG